MAARRMIGRTLVLMLVSLLPLARAQRTAEVLPFQQLAPGLAVLQGQVVVGGKRMAITAVRGSLRMYRLEVAVPQNDKSGDSVTTFQEHSQAAVVLSGGFLTSFYPPIPLGLVKHGQVLVNRAVGGDLLNGLLLVRAGKPTIQPFSGAGDVAGWDEALQSGPMLLNAGHSALPNVAEIRTPSTRQLIENEYARAFVATLPDDQFLLAVTGAVSLRALLDLLTRPEAQGGLACLDALNLGGGGSAGVLVHAGTRQISSGNIQSYLANAILLKPVAANEPRRATPLRRRN